MSVYAAEEQALPDGGRRFRRFAHVREFVLGVMTDPWWEDRFGGAPVQIDVLRRSRSSTFSAAHVTSDGWDGVIWIRDGSWNAVTVVHELAHVALGPPSADRAAHGPEFVAALVALWRRHLGVHAYGALLGALADQGVADQRDRRADVEGEGA